MKTKLTSHDVFPEIVKLLQLPELKYKKIAVFLEVGKPVIIESQFLIETNHGLLEGNFTKATEE